MSKFLVAALVLSVATPAFADFYIVQDATTKRCTITESRPTTTRTKVVGPDGRVYKTREEASTAMKTVKVCEER
jgi:hypothetical protein